MKAVTLSKFGTPDVMSVTEVERPSPAKGEVLIRVEAAGLNRLDHYIREGGVTNTLPFPHVLGSDAVGTIEALGKAVDGWSVGERVIPMPGYPLEADGEVAQPLALSPSYGIVGLARAGTYSEYIVAPAKWLLNAPVGLSSQELATAPMPLVTAVQAVRGAGGVVAGDTVLIHAGASGTGSYMIQVARSLGARVATTIRTAAKAEFVSGLGAEVVAIGSDADTLRKFAPGGFDVVVDNLGGSNLANSLDLTRPAGTVVLMGNVLGLESAIPVRSLFFPQRRIVGTLMGGKEDLQWGLDRIADGQIKPTLDRTWRLDEAIAAHQHLADAKALGSAVFDIS